jgi:prevent-host-death family protein
MREIGVRELKASLSETLRLVDRGERVRVTVHGRPVADIVPAGAIESSDGLRALVAAGRLAPPARSRPTHPPRLVDASGSATAAVLAERDAER